MSDLTVAWVFSCMACFLFGMVVERVRKARSGS